MPTQKKPYLPTQCFLGFFFTKSPKTPKKRKKWPNCLVNEISGIFLQDLALNFHNTQLVLLQKGSVRG
jgi:hypothetical protein